MSDKKYFNHLFIFLFLFQENVFFSICNILSRYDEVEKNVWHYLGKTNEFSPDLLCESKFCIKRDSNSIWSRKKNVTQFFVLLSWDKSAINPKFCPMLTIIGMIIYTIIKVGHLLSELCRNSDSIYIRYHDSETLLLRLLSKIRLQVSTSIPTVNSDSRWPTFLIERFLVKSIN